MPSKLYRKFIISEDYKILIYAACVDLILAPVFVHFDPFGLNSFLDSNISIGGIYALVVYVFVLLCIAIHNELIEKRIRTDYKNLINLGNLLVDSTVINHNLRKVNFEENDDTDKAKSEIMDWANHVIRVYKQIDPVRAAIWMFEGAKLFNMEFTDSIPEERIFLHDEITKRLREDINYFSELRDSNRER